MRSGSPRLARFDSGAAPFPVQTHDCNDPSPQTPLAGEVRARTPLEPHREPRRNFRRPAQVRWGAGTTSDLRRAVCYGDSRASRSSRPARRCVRSLTPASPLSAHSRPVKSWLSWNAARKTASLLLVAGYNGANNGFNFDGYGRGQLLVRIPLHWRVSVTCRNAASVRHSCAIVRGPLTTTPAFRGAATPSPTLGLRSGQTARFTFKASRIRNLSGSRVSSPGTSRRACGTCSWSEASSVRPSRRGPASSCRLRARFCLDPANVEGDEVR